MIAEELPQGLLMVVDFVTVNELKKMSRGIECQSRFGEVRVRREKTVWGTMNIGEVTASPSGDEDLLPGAIGMIQNCDPASPFSSFYGTHQSGCACT
jgi:hypothetical protein